MVNKETSKQWFETGDFPTQAQFYQVFDWLRWKDEGISVADVANLQNILNTLQVSLNNALPNQLISGGNVSIDTDDGTTLSMYLPETKYKLKTVPYTQAAVTINLALRPAAGLFRIDVFYLDETGFHVMTGAVSATPVKPGVPDGSLELSNILIGFDNALVTVHVADVQWGRIGGDIYDQTDLKTKFDNKADLVSGKVPSSQLPSYVDDVIEGKWLSTTSFEVNDGSGWVAVTPEQGKIYADVNTNYTYRWTGSVFVQFGGGGGTWGSITGTLDDQTDLKAALDDINNNIPSDAGIDIFNYYNFQ